MFLIVGDMDGLFDFVVVVVNVVGKEKGIDGLVVIILWLLIMLFFQFLLCCDLWKKVYEVWSVCGVNSGEIDNCGIIVEMFKLWVEKVEFLGYDIYFVYKLELEMVGIFEVVVDLLLCVWEFVKVVVDVDVVKFEVLFYVDGFEGFLEFWDWYYYLEKCCKVEYDLDEVEIKLFFQLDCMIDVVFVCVNCLFGFEFILIDGLCYYLDVCLWEVMCNGQYVVLFVGDYFVCGLKWFGVWCSVMCSQ